MLSMHFKLYQGYVKNANELLEKLPTAKGSDDGALKRRLGWELDGMRFHELYFDNLGGNGVVDPKSKIFEAIRLQFGSFEKWKSDFIETGLMRGIGWAVLYLDVTGQKLINLWINEHDVGHLAGGRPILIMDVFEHAYMPQMGLDRAQYIEVFFQNVNWNVVNARFIEPCSRGI